MKVRREIILSLLLTLGAWAWVSWPLPLHMTSAICTVPDNPRGAPPQEMVAGDHLQLLYQFWLAHDTWFGPTPWSHNLYEFNVGDDEARRVYNTYYFPYNLTYSIGHVLGSQALGWNLGGLLSVWVGLWFTQLWLRRYVPDCLWITWAAALAGQLIPYRWHTLLNGSPTGLALMWIPVILYGLDVCIRDRKRWGAVLAGAAVFFSGWSDTHALFFGAMVCAAWALPTHWHATNSLKIRGEHLLAYVKTGWPMIAWVGLIIIQAKFVKNSVKGTNTASGRKPEEVGLFSHGWSDTVDWKGAGGVAETFLGWPFFAALLVFLYLLVKGLIQKRVPLRRASIFGLVTLGILVISVLATGVKNPWGVPGWNVVTTLVPPMNMIRQPAKVFLVLCPLVSLALATGLYGAARKYRPLLSILAVIGLGYSWTWRVDPTICILDKENEAYAAVAGSGDKPQAMALPLWPGDSHWSSLYQHYASLYRIRMINGYRPSRMDWYVEQVFEPFSQFNTGSFPDRALDALLETGVNHLVLHENAFPEKVSPFAVGQTLTRMLEHPRLRYLEQDGPVHAFRVLSKPTSEAVQHPPADWTSFGSVRRWNGEYAKGEIDIQPDPLAFRNQFARLDEANEPVQLFHYPLSMRPDQKLMFRTAGPGILDLKFNWGDERSWNHRISLTQAVWNWQHLQLPDHSDEGAKPLELLASATGTANLDITLLVPTAWEPEVNGVRVIPAGTLFHAGHTDLSSNAVVFLPERDPYDEILYGPSLPLRNGGYALRLEFETDAPDNTLLGKLRLRGIRNVETDVVSGRKAELNFEIRDHDLFDIGFRYNGAATVQINRIVLVPAWTHKAATPKPRKTFNLRP